MQIQGRTYSKSCEMSLLLDVIDHSRPNRGSRCAGSSFLVTLWCSSLIHFLV